MFLQQQHHSLSTASNASTPSPAAGRLPVAASLVVKGGGPPGDRVAAEFFSRAYEDGDEFLSSCLQCLYNDDEEGKPSKEDEDHTTFLLLLAPTPIDPKGVRLVDEFPLIPSGMLNMQGPLDASVEDAIRETFLACRKHDFSSCSSYENNHTGDPQRHDKQGQRQAAKRIKKVPLKQEEEYRVEKDKTILPLCSWRPLENVQEEEDEQEQTTRSCRLRNKKKKSSASAAGGQWFRKFEQLVRYKEIHGHCLVACSTTGVPTSKKDESFPSHLTRSTSSTSSFSFSASCSSSSSATGAGGTAEDFLDNDDYNSLARWVKRQRYQYRLLESGAHSTLTDERKQALDEIGFVWKSHEARWEDRFQELMEFRSHSGHCNVPKGYTSNRQLAIWVKCQRRQYKLIAAGRFGAGAGQNNMNERGDNPRRLTSGNKRKITLTPSRVQRLNEVGFCWGRAAGAGCKR